MLIFIPIRFRRKKIIGGFCTDRISSSGYIYLEKETGKN